MTPPTLFELITLFVSAVAAVYAILAVRAGRKANAIAFRSDWISALDTLRSIHRHLDHDKSDAISRLVEVQKQRDLKSSRSILDENMRDQLYSVRNKAQYWSPKDLCACLDASIESLRTLERLALEDEEAPNFLQQASAAREEMRKSIGMAIDILNSRVEASAA